MERDATQFCAVELLMLNGDQQWDEQLMGCGWLGKACWNFWNERTGNSWNDFNDFLRSEWLGDVLLGCWVRLMWWDAGG